MSIFDFYRELHWTLILLQDLAIYAFRQKKFTFIYITAICITLF